MLYLIPSNLRVKEHKLQDEKTYITYSPKISQNTGQGCYMLSMKNHRMRQRLTLQDVGNGAEKPMKPVEDRTIFALWIATEQSDKWL